MDYSQVKLEDRCRDFTWIKSLYDAQKLKFSSMELFTDNHFEQLRTLIRVTEEIYSGLWDLDVEMPRGVAFTDALYIRGIIIHFPDITITNSVGLSHQISNLFVSVRIVNNSNTIRIDGIKGFRTSYAYKEYMSNYTHSHLPCSKNNIQRAIRDQNIDICTTDFCTGSGHINDFLAEVNSDPAGLTRDALTPLLLQITSLVTWESLEGGPHRKIRDLSNRPTNGRMFGIDVSFLKTFHTRLIESEKVRRRQNEELKTLLTFKLENNRYTLVIDELFKSFIILNSAATINRNMYMCIQGDGNYYQLGSSPGFEAAPDTDGFVFVFQGREIPFSIEVAPTTLSEDQLVEIIHPEILEQLKKNIEYEINFKKIRKSTTEKYRD